MGKDSPLSRTPSVRGGRLLLRLTLCLLASASSAFSADARIDPRLAELISVSPPDRFITALADLSVQLDLNALGERMRDEGLSRQERAARVRRELESTARREQDALQDRLEEWRRRGWVRSWQGVRIVNRLILEVRVDAVAELAVSAAFSNLWDGHRSRPLAKGSPRRVSRWAQRPWSREVRGRNWALDALKIPDLWDRGLQGQGVVIGILDGGVDGSHPQLAPNRRQRDSWFDPFEGRAEPWDSSGHGTAVLSAAAGRNQEGYRIGVAPRARWVAALANPRGVFHPRFFTLAADWMLFQGRPDVLLMPFGFEPGECDLQLRPFLDAFRAAEVFSVFAAGNEGPTKGTDISPANYTGLYPGDGAAFAVGGLERDLGLYPESGRGPSSCGERVYPTVVAPAAGLPVAAGPGRLRYDWRAGTSFAAGIAAGIVVLCYQAHSNVLLETLEEALTSSARDLGAAGRDDQHGFGLLDPAGALQLLDGQARGR